MRRRDFIAGLGGAAVWPLAAHAQLDERGRALQLRILSLMAEGPRRISHRGASLHRCTSRLWHLRVFHRQWLCNFAGVLDEKPRDRAERAVL